MQDVDLNLLTTLDVLLTERSVTKAAQRLGLSPSAMSRALSRLRDATGDPLLVLAGRTLVPTPYAERIAGRVHDITRDARAVLQPASDVLDLASLERTFTIRANDSFVGLVGPMLMARIVTVAPHVLVRFVPKPDKDALPLRDGTIDLEIGVLGSAAPELKTRMLFRDRFVGVCRTGHPLLTKLTAKRYVAYPHVVVSRKASFASPVDDALARLGLRRNVAMVVPSHANAIDIARRSDVLGLVPRSALLGGFGDIHRPPLDGVAPFELPVTTPDITVTAIWHPRLHADAAHRWLRETIFDLCAVE
ncbi:DNA-binding transcriptional regulator, LysR family [Luteibacter sp. UNC138MFCol5.1]|uniref:LysR family transcriptional regulator n=1 Tax=Luteibacter sp. UNC138MFCol5.1 TaxID=1502774 RepID=UPI0008D57725|nr:LysR family transcriptional regulator [Luteibacter sp. UNC138MFCol5.1]SEP01647.1 DNA-binding transcriptional regulator, LysR family [Luteibacter sp. UNC138MFCol5.1]